MRRQSNDMGSGKLNKKTKGSIIFLFITIIIALILVVFAIKIKDNNINIYKEGTSNNIETSDETPVIKEEKKLQIYQGSERVVAVMIDNEPGAWPQTGIQDAFVVYECIVEGGQTRLMALFKGKDTEKVGPVRSSRHYFVKFATEYDAIYAHFGWSTLAEKFIKDNKINNVNGLYYDGSTYWREGSGYHNAFTSMKNLKDRATNLGYSLKGTEETPFKYSIDSYDLENGKEITKVNMVYSSSHSVSYEYNEEKGVFMRYQRGNAHTDRVTKEQFYAKNIIIQNATNYNLNDGTPRQEVENVGKGTGYYLTNGKYINITWEKTSDTSKTHYYDILGNEIILNDGLTFIQVVPTSGSVKFTEKVIATSDVN